MTQYIVDGCGWQEACNGIMCSRCPLKKDWTCKLEAYITSQPVYGETLKDIIEEIKEEAYEIDLESEANDAPETYSYYSGFRKGMLRAVAILRAERGEEE